MVDLHRLRAELTAAVACGPRERARRICEVCVAAVPVAGAAISLMADANRRDILYSSDAHATELEELQFGLGEGPCVEAFTTGRPVLIADLEDPPDPRWPMFAAAAVVRTPARAAYAFPLQIGAIAVGILDLYRVEPGLLDRAQLAAALLVADAALWSLLDLRAEGHDGAGPDDIGEGDIGEGDIGEGDIGEGDIGEGDIGEGDIGEGDGGAGDDGAGDGGAGDRGSGDRSGGWPLVLHRDHAVVYQATGMVIAQAGLSAEAALAVLRGYAFAHDRSLHEIATEVLARRLSFADNLAGDEG